MSQRNRLKSVDSKKQKKMTYNKVLPIFKAFGYHYKTHWKLAAIAYSGMFVMIFTSLFIPWPLKLILDHVVLNLPLPEQAVFLTQWINTDQMSLLSFLVIAFIALNILNSIFSFLHKIGLLTMAASISADIRVQVFTHLQRLSLSFHNTTRSGDLTYRLIDDTPNLNKILVQAPQALIYRIATIGAHIGIMFMLEWRLALIAFSIIPLIYFYHHYFGQTIQKATKKKKKKESNISSVVAENVAAMALIQAYGREDLQQKKFDSENKKSVQFGIRAMKFSKIFKRANAMMVACGTAGVVYYGGLLAMDSTILPGTLVLFAAYMKRLYSPIKKLAQLMIDIAKSIVSGERLLEIIESDMVMADHPDAVPAPPIKGKFEFRDVSFQYLGGEEVLKNMNCSIKSGETIAIVGHSGAGKSTFISLLMRFYNPTKGQILIDDHDVKKLTIKSIRKQTTIVMQGAKLLNRTVRENIAFGKIGATEEEIIHAAKLAQAHDFIMQMPEGYNSMIEEDGENISGGQRQRINIARAVIRDTSILILDEPATALDAKSETQVHTAFNKLTQGKTTFIIAHKFSTISHADKIILLDKGKIAAFGSHDELIATSQEYHKLNNLQFGSRHDEEALQVAADEKSVNDRLVNSGLEETLEK